MPVRRTLLVLLLCTSAGWSAELKTLKQETITGDLVSISSKEVVLKAASGNVTTPIDQVLILTFGQETGPLPSNLAWVDVELTDGTELHCATFSVKKDQVEVTLLAGQTVKFPLSSLSSMLTNAQLEKNRKAWADVLDKTSRNHDVVARTTDAGPNAVEGLIGDADESGESIRFTLSSGQEGKLSLSKIFGMAFSRKPNPDAAVVQCRLSDAHHDLVMVSAAESTPTGFTVTTPAGAKIEYTTALVVKMDYSHGKRDYLSDLTPVTVEQRFWLFAEERTVDQYRDWRYRGDKDLDDRPLELNNVPYEKGLALHSHTELVYDLKGDYREFHAVVGIDREVPDRRPVVVRIEGDGIELAKFTFVRGEKDKTAGPVPVVRNIKDVKKLRIIVTHLDEDRMNDIGLKAVLADAFVTK